MTDLPLTDADTEIRTIRVTTWLSSAEAEIIDHKRGHYNRSSFLRACGLDKQIAQAPAEVNRDQWADLGRVAGNLSQLVRHLNFAAHQDGPAGDVKATLQASADAKTLVDELRAWLLGAVATTVKAG